MNKTSRIIFITFLIILISLNIYGQRNGDVVLSYGIGLVSKGMFSIKIFPVDKFAFELFGSGIPGTFVWGAGIHYHTDIARPNTYFQFGFANLIGFGEGVEFDSTNTDSTMDVGASSWVFNAGIGREFNVKSSLGYFSAGPTYMFKRTIIQKDLKTNQESEKEDEPLGWFGFIEGGKSEYAEKKDKKQEE